MPMLAPNIKDKPCERERMLFLYIKPAVIIVVEEELKIMEMTIPSNVVISKESKNKT